MEYTGPSEEDIEKNRLRKIAIEALRDRVTAAIREAKAIAAAAQDLQLHACEDVAGEIANYHYTRIHNWLTSRL